MVKVNEKKALEAECISAFQDNIYKTMNPEMTISTDFLIQPAFSQAILEHQIHHAQRVGLDAFGTHADRICKAQAL